MLILSFFPHPEKTPVGYIKKNEHKRAKAKSYPKDTP